MLEESTWGQGPGSGYILKTEPAAFVDGWAESVGERRGQGEE